MSTLTYDLKQARLSLSDADSYLVPIPDRGRTESPLRHPGYQPVDSLRQKSCPPELSLNDLWRRESASKDLESVERQLDTSSDSLAFQSGDHSRATPPLPSTPVLLPSVSPNYFCQKPPEVIGQRESFIFFDPELNLAPKPITPGDFNKASHSTHSPPKQATDPVQFSTSPSPSPQVTADQKSTMAKPEVHENESYDTQKSIRDKMTLSAKDFKLLTNSAYVFVAKREAKCKPVPRPWKEKWQAITKEFLEEQGMGEKFFLKGRDEYDEDKSLIYPDDEKAISYLVYNLLKQESSKAFSKKRKSLLVDDNATSSKKAKANATSTVGSKKSSNVVSDDGTEDDEDNEEEEAPQTRNGKDDNGGDEDEDEDEEEDEESVTGEKIQGQAICKGDPFAAVRSSHGQAHSSLFSLDARPQSSVQVKPLGQGVINFQAINDYDLASRAAEAAKIASSPMNPGRKTPNQTTDDFDYDEFLDLPDTPDDTKVLDLAEKGYINGKQHGKGFDDYQPNEQKSEATKQTVGQSGGQGTPPALDRHRNEHGRPTNPLSMPVTTRSPTVARFELVEILYSVQARSGIDRAYRVFSIPSTATFSHCYGQFILGLQEEDKIGLASAQSCIVRCPGNEGSHEFPILQKQNEAIWKSIVRKIVPLVRSGGTYEGEMVTLEFF